MADSRHSDTVASSSAESMPELLERVWDALEDVAAAIDEHGTGSG